MRILNVRTEDLQPLPFRMGDCGPRGSVRTFIPTAPRDTASPDFIRGFSPFRDRAGTASVCLLGGHSSARGVFLRFPPALNSDALKPSRCRVSESFAMLRAGSAIRLVVAGTSAFSDTLWLVREPAIFVTAFADAPLRYVVITASMEVKILSLRELRSELSSPRGDTGIQSTVARLHKHLPPDWAYDMIIGAGHDPAPYVF